MNNAYATNDKTKVYVCLDGVDLAAIIQCLAAVSTNVNEKAQIQIEKTFTKIEDAVAVLVEAADAT